MYKVRSSKAYKKSIKKIIGSGKIKLKEIELAINILLSGKKVPEKYKDHKLAGIFADYRECHIKPNLLLIYKIEKQELILVLINIGSHAELFK